MISIEDFEQQLQVGVESGKITQELADNEALRRRQWLAGQLLASLLELPETPIDPPIMK